MPFDRNFLIKTNKKLSLYGVQQTVFPPMIILPSVSLLPLVSFVMFSDCGDAERCPFSDNLQGLIKELGRADELDEWGGRKVKGRC